MTSISVGAKECGVPVPLGGSGVALSLPFETLEVGESIPIEVAVEHDADASDEEVQEIIDSELKRVRISVRNAASTYRKRTRRLDQKHKVAIVEGVVRVWRTA